MSLRRLRLRLSDALGLPKPDELSSRYGRAFERAVLMLLKAKDAVAALKTFIESYGEPHSGAFNKIRMLIPWAKRVREVSEAPPVVAKIGDAVLTAQADFLISYEDGRREIVELKSHILKRGEWRVKAEWSFAAKVMRMLYRKAGYDYPIRLIYFVEERGGVRPEQEVYMYPNDEKDDQHLLKALEERIGKIKQAQDGGH
ncbi:hypothetical protein B7L68_04140 [Thermoproteus sp. CP80]|jgi:hypothetical protein|uniref:hypothetical protein n=1 Tax=Thermoproteus sp. CP80 TaxID=1650659 RepID=UPI0007486328|nr:hypothetical protein [Thermoproteus sp. CP80]KUO85663.1 MAG: hypothetical protein AT711_02890 [Thermoproteus sp. CIS_19]PLC64877.1 hypothetical protein B7L68_04140 [Thermoproteus sp. CP80]